MNSRRIVVTGMGIVSPLGCGVEAAWARLLGGYSGLSRLPDEMTEGIPAKVGGVVPVLTSSFPWGFDAGLTVDPKDQKKMDRFSLFALSAAQQALSQAGWDPDTDRARERTATIVASGIGGFGAIVDAVRTTDHRGPRRLSPFTVPSFLANMARGKSPFVMAFAARWGRRLRHALPVPRLSATRHA